MKADSPIEKSITRAARVMSLLLLTFVLIASASPQRSSETPKHQMSKKELKILLSSAKTAKDHQQIAAYFAQQAQIFEKKSGEYKARCEDVAEYPMKYNTKYPSEYDHCRFWAQYYASKSRDAEKTATLHEQLANGLLDGKR